MSKISCDFSWNVWNFHPRVDKTTTKLRAFSLIFEDVHIVHSAKLFTKVNIKETLAFPLHNIFISESSLTLNSTHDSYIRGRNFSSCLCEINMRISRMQLEMLQKILVLFFLPLHSFPRRSSEHKYYVHVIVWARDVQAPAFPLLLPKWPNLRFCLDASQTWEVSSERSWELWTFSGCHWGRFLVNVCEDVPLHS